MRTNILALALSCVLVACSDPSGAAAPEGLVPTDAETSDEDDTTDGTEPTEATTEPEPCTSFGPWVEGSLLVHGAGANDAIGRCGEAMHPMVMAEGSRHRLTLVGWVSEAPARLELRDWNGTVLGQAQLVSGETVDLEATWSGEHALVVRSEDGSEAAYTLTSECTEGCERLTTRYPIVFMHGMAGTDSFFDLLDYWYDVVPTLQEAGYPAHVAQVDPFQPSPVRSERWREHLDALMASGQARRVNLVGHSQGGLDARYLAAVLDPGGQIQSVTTVSTPHRGAAAADFLYGIVDGSALGVAVADAVFDSLAAYYGIVDDQDIEAQALQLTSDASAQFNLDILDRPDVAYYSWAGVTCELIDVVCQASNGGEIVDPLLSATHLLTSFIEGPNDGLVSVESAMWGEFLGELSADHLDEVGLLPGTTALGFDHRQFYLDEAARLARAGF